MPVSFIFILCFVVSAGFAQSSHATLLALSKRNHTLAVVDAATLKVTATISVGDDPHEVILRAVVGVLHQQQIIISHPI